MTGGTDRVDVRVVACPAELAHDRLGGCSVVVFDVLRASTVLVAALAAGALDAWPAVTPDEAIALATRWPRDTVLLAGERDTLHLPGFDAGNSPAEVAVRAAGRHLVLATTNGTVTIRACETAAHLLVGALTNAAAVARLLARLGRPALCVCAGSRGRFDAADLTGVGAVVARLARLPRLGRLDDLARVALRLFESQAGRLRAWLAETDHGRRLIEAGFADDLAACAALDATAVVPRWYGGRLCADPLAGRLPPTHF